MNAKFVYDVESKSSPCGKGLKTTPIYPMTCRTKVLRITALQKEGTTKRRHGWASI